MKSQARLVAVALLALCAAEAAAQTLRGYVLDGERGDRVADVVVVLWGHAGARDSTVSRENGSFGFRAAPGEYYLTARHVAYERYQGEPFRLEEGERREVNVLLSPGVQALDRAEVVAERRLPHMIQGGFYERQAQAAGRIIDRRDIERIRPRVVTDLLRRIPGVLVVDGDVRFSTHRSRTCAPTLVIDDVPYRLRGEAGSFLIDYIIMPEHIEAIEVHARTGGLPARYAGRNSPCGAILIWSRRGRG